MKTRVFTLIIFLLAGLLANAPVWAQKQLVPVLRGWGAAGVRAAAKNTVFNAVKPVKITGALSYVPPRQIDLQQLDRLSTTLNRSVLLSRSKAGTLRDLAELEAYIVSDAPQALRLQAGKLLLAGLNEKEIRLFLDWYPFLTTNTQFSLENNDWLLRILPAFKKQVAYVSDYKETILNALKITEIDRAGMLARAVGADRKLIMLGEVHGRANLRAEIADFLLQYRALYPNRKMVLLSEFLPSSYPALWQPGQAIPADFFQENPSYSNEINRLAKELDMEVYGLEDIRFTYQKTLAMSQLDFTVANTSFRVMPVRNKYWENIIRLVMAQVRRKYPEAVFFVHAGNMHIDKSVMESLPGMLKDENPFCVAFRNGFQYGFLGFLKDKKPSVMAEVTKPYLITWAKAMHFDRALGFDAQVLLPFETNGTAGKQDK